MKTQVLKFLAGSVIFFGLQACSNEAQNPIPANVNPTTNEGTLERDVEDLNHCYLIIDKEGNQFRSGYTLVLSSTEIGLDKTEELLGYKFSVDQSNMAHISTHTSSSELVGSLNEIDFNPQNFPVVEGESYCITDISTWNPSFNDEGVKYFTPGASSKRVVSKFTRLSVTELDMDTAAGKGNTVLSFEMEDADGTKWIGNYNGEVEILVAEIL